MTEPTRSRRGVALPMALLVVVVLTILLAAGFAALSSERRVHANDEAALDAFTLAETGLELFIAKRDSFGFKAAPPAVSESTRIALGGGYADVILRRIRNDTVAGRYGYAVRSHGVSTVASLSGTPQAERTVAEYAVWQAGSMNVLAGWTSLSGLHKNGSSDMGSGADQCGKQPAVAGVAVPGNPGYTQNAVTPDITIPPAAWPSFSNPSYWPTILVKGDFALPGNGQGTLIVTGSLTISGNITWDGVLLVGDNLTSNGNNAVNGATVTGLNVKLGATLPQGDVGNGTKSFNYNSCNIAKAMAAMGQLVGYSNAWVDNWPTY